MPTSVQLAKVACIIFAPLTFVFGYATIKILGVFFIQLQNSFDANASIVSFTLSLPMSVVFLGGKHHLISHYSNAKRERIKWFRSFLWVGIQRTGDTKKLHFGGNIYLRWTFVLLLGHQYYIRANITCSLR